MMLMMETLIPTITKLLGEQIASWANSNKCTRYNLNEILHTLSTHRNNMPKEVGALLQILRTIKSIDKCGVQYTYFVLEI